MSRFDEEPDGDVHGECVYEIHTQQIKIKTFLRRIEEIRQFSHKMDDMAQGITEQQVYALSTELRVLLGIDDNDEKTDHTDYTPVDNSTWAPRS